jgi:hypothetical protein
MAMMDDYDFLRPRGRGRAAGVGGYNPNAPIPDAGGAAGVDDAPVRSGAPPKNPKVGDTWDSPTGPTRFNGDRWVPIGR